MKSVPILAIVLVVASISSTTAHEPAAITMKKIGERTWLIDPQGKPFFAHGVTHVNNRAHGVDVEKLGQALKHLGFNACGYGCPEKLKATTPYVEGRNYVPMSTYRTTDKSFTFVDIFDPKIQTGFERAVERVCVANRKNPYLIGYFWTDLGAWPLKNPTGKNWVEFIRELPEDAPGHQAFLKFQRTFKGTAEQRDKAFLRLIAREYFGVFGKANKKYDPDHLIFGDRFALNTFVPEVVEEMLPYVDAIAIQPHFRPKFPKQEFDRIHKMTGKPIIICDFAVRFKDGGKKVRGWKLEENAKIAGEKYTEYVRDAMATPYVIGVFWCNPIDSKPGFSKAGIKQGLFDTGLKPRPELNKSIRELNEYIAEQTP